MENSLTTKNSPCKTRVYRKSTPSNYGYEAYTQNEYKAAIMKTLSDRTVRSCIIAGLRNDINNDGITSDNKLTNGENYQFLKYDDKFVANREPTKSTGKSKKSKAVAVFESTKLDSSKDLDWRPPNYEVNEIKSLSYLDIAESYGCLLLQKEAKSNESIDLNRFAHTETIEIPSSESSKDYESSTKISSRDGGEITIDESNSILSINTKNPKENTKFNFTKRVKRLYNRERKKSKMSEELKSVTLPNMSSDEESNCDKPKFVNNNNVQNSINDNKIDITDKFIYNSVNCIEWHQSYAGRDESLLSNSSSPSMKSFRSFSTSLIDSERSFSDTSDISTEDKGDEFGQIQHELCTRQHISNSKKHHRNQYGQRNDVKAIMDKRKTFYFNNSSMEDINFYFKSEILIKIFSYLTIIDLCNASKVCKKWHQLYLSPELWMKISILNYSKNIDYVMNLLLQRLAFTSPYACLNIKQIQLDGCIRLSDHGLHMIAMRCPELTSIRLSGCAEITGDGVTTILANCPNVVYMNFTLCDNLSTFNFSGSSGLEFGNNASFLELRYLDFSDCTSLQDRSLGGLATCVTLLECLYIRRCDSISNVGIEAIAENCNNLKEISLNDCYNISDIGVIKLIRQCKKLQYISLAKCAITDACVESIAKNSNLLRHLNLHECEAVTDGGILHIWSACDHLRSLDIGKCENITNKSMFGLCRLKQLKRLCIKKCTNITDSGIRKLVTNSSSLRYLDIRSCCFTNETVLYIKRRCKNCVVRSGSPDYNTIIKL